MKRLEAITMWVAVALSCAATGKGQPSTAGDSLAANAALKYWQAYAVLPKLEAKKSEALREAAANAGPVDQDIVAVIRLATACLRELRRGASLPRCAWGVSYEDGPEALLPHLAMARELARFACVRARWHFEGGRNTEAIADLMATMTLGRHCGSDGLLISLLVDFAVEDMTIRMMAAYLPRLDADALAALSKRIERLPATKTMREAVSAEKPLFLEWWIGKLAAAGGKERLLRLLGGLEEADKAALARLSPEELINAFEQLRPVYDRLAELMSAPVAEIGNLEAELSKAVPAEGPSARLARIMLPAFSRIRRTEAQHQTHLQMLQAAIAVLRSGPEQLKQPPYTDPCGARPFEYERFKGGFRLRSELTDANGYPVELTVGQRQ